jgi:hypothetical protein
MNNYLYLKPLTTNKAPRHIPMESKH